MSAVRLVYCLFLVTILSGRKEEHEKQDNTISKAVVGEIFLDKDDCEHPGSLFLSQSWIKKVNVLRSLVICQVLTII